MDVTRNRLALIALAATTLAGCSGGSDEPITGTPLDGMTQKARTTRCFADYERLRDLGVWAHGGAVPGVNEAAWQQLTEAEQTNLITTAACIGLGGKAGTRIVTVQEAGGVRDLATRRVVIAP
ncbi:hypothetical protein ACLBKU_11895 [Erythrobacter sp. NE805]|uniref:hypothetical protein n=1 Tax=Erythrobacter sp. NE805 TaxID=3389875 RepID=UPI00396B2BA4